MANMNLHAKFDNAANKINLFYTRNRAKCQANNKVLKNIIIIVVKRGFNMLKREDNTDQANIVTNQIVNKGNVNY